MKGQRIKVVTYIICTSLYDKRIITTIEVLREHTDTSNSDN